MAEFITIMVYCVLGTALMLFGTFVVDLVIPCEFPAEIKKGNVAVGSVMAGISVGIGTAVHESLLTGIASTIYYYVVGLVFCVLGYLALNLINRKYDLNKEISGGNPAAGIMVAGMFIGLSIIISGVIM